MMQTIEAMIDQNGFIRTLEPITLPKLRRVFITILNEQPSDEQIDLALLSQPTLFTDWDNPDEDKAWSHLSQLPSI